MSGLAPSGFLQKIAEGLGPCGQGGSRRVCIPGGISRPYGRAVPVCGALKPS